MRIRWTTRIATAAGLLTLIAGIATGGGPAHAATRPSAVSAVTTTVGYVTTTVGYVTGALGQRTLILH
jgi:hypothetical protein